MRWGALVLAMALAPAAAQAQPAPQRPRAGSVEVSGGVAWTGGFDTGSIAANEPRNPSVGTDPLTLFKAEGRFEAAPGVDARVGVYLSPHVSIEGGVQFSQPVLSVRLTDDFEDAADVTAEETITQYLVDGSVLYHFGGGTALMPFVSGGAGYLRQLHEDHADIITGAEFHAGAGVKYWFGAARRVGLRAEARLSSRDRSAGFDRKRRYLPAVTAGVAFLF